MLHQFVFRAAAAFCGAFAYWCSEGCVTLARVAAATDGYGWARWVFLVVALVAAALTGLCALVALVGPAKPGEGGV